MLRKLIAVFTMVFVVLAISIAFVVMVASANTTSVHFGTPTSNRVNPLMRHPVAHAATAYAGVCPIYANPIWYGSAGYAHADGQIGSCPGYYNVYMSLTVCVQDSVGGWHDQSCAYQPKTVAGKLTAETSYYANCGHWKRTRTSGTSWWLNPVTYTSGSGTTYSSANYRC